MIELFGSILKNSSILDFPHPGLDGTVWDSSGKLKPEHKKLIETEINKIIEQHGFKESDKWIKQIKIVGSLTTYQYVSDSDIDVHIIVDLDKFIKLNNLKLSKEEASDFLEVVHKQLSKQKILLPNTKHTLELYFETPFSGVDPNASIYDVKEDKWVTDPVSVKIDFDVEEMKPFIVDMANTIAGEMDVSFGEIKRNVKRIEELHEVMQQWPKEQRKVFKQKLEDKLQDIETEIKELLKTKKEILTERREDYKQLSEQEIKFKYLQKFGYFYIISQLEDILDEVEEITVEEIPEIKEVMKEAYMRHAYWISPTGRVYEVRGDRCSSYTHDQWILDHLEELKNDYGIDLSREKDYMRSQKLIRNDWIRIGDSDNTNWSVEVNDIKNIPSVLEIVLEQFMRSGTDIWISDGKTDHAIVTYPWASGTLQKTINKALRSPVKMAQHDKHAHAGKLCIDFDRTITNKDNHEEIGELAIGVKEAFDQLKKDGWYIIIYSSRADHQEGVDQIKEFMEQYKLPYDEIFVGKPVAEWYIDDRNIVFTNWQDILKNIQQHEVHDTLMCEDDHEKMEWKGEVETWVCPKCNKEKLLKKASHGTYYHVTSRENWERIQTDLRLVPGRGQSTTPYLGDKKFKSETGYIYVWSSLAKAKEMKQGDKNLVILAITGITPERDLDQLNFLWKEGVVSYWATVEEIIGRQYMPQSKKELLEWGQNLTDSQWNKLFGAYRISGEISNKNITKVAQQTAKYDFSSTQVDLPKDTAQQIIEWGVRNIPDEELWDDETQRYGRELEPHVTVKYGILSNDVNEIKKVFEDEKPVKLKFRKTKFFKPEQFPHDVIVIEVVSDDLHKLNKKVCDNLKNEDMYPNYQPHATIAYVKEGLGKKYEGLEVLSKDLEVTIDSVLISPKEGDRSAIELKAAFYPSIVQAPDNPRQQDSDVEIPVDPDTVSPEETYFAPQVDKPRKSILDRILDFFKNKQEKEAAPPPVSEYLKEHVQPMGATELMEFRDIAPEDVQEEVDVLIDEDKIKDAWVLIEKFLGKRHLKFADDEVHCPNCGRLREHEDIIQEGKCDQCQKFFKPKTTWKMTEPFTPLPTTFTTTTNEENLNSRYPWKFMGKPKGPAYSNTNDVYEMIKGKKRISKTDKVAKLEFLDTCVNILEHANPYFEDATQMAQTVEDATEISKQEFLNFTDVTSEFTNLINSKSVSFWKSNKENLTWIYDNNEDIHYFFGGDLSLSSNLQIKTFKFDPNSTQNQGRWRLRDPKEFEKMWTLHKQKDLEVPGISFIVGTTKDGTFGIQAIRFEKDQWDEEKASKWWEEHKSKFTKTWTQSDWETWKKTHQKKEATYSKIGRFWIDPEGKVYKLSEGETHEDVEDKINQGWVRVGDSWHGATIFQIRLKSLFNIPSFVDSFIVEHYIPNKSIEVEGDEGYLVIDDPFPKVAIAIKKTLRTQKLQKGGNFTNVADSCYTDQQMNDIYQEQHEYNDSDGGGNVYHDFNNSSSDFPKVPETYKVRLDLLQKPIDRKTPMIPDYSVVWYESLPATEYHGDSE